MTRPTEEHDLALWRCAGCSVMRTTTTATPPRGWVVSVAAGGTAGTVRCAACHALAPSPFVLPRGPRFGRTAPILPRGVGPTVWTGGDMSSVLDPFTCSLFSECRPDFVTIHCGPDRLLRSAEKLIARVRQLVPGVRIHVGIGCDVWIGKAIAAGGTDKAIRATVDELKLAVKMANDCGAECVTFDAEAACKLNSLVTHKVATLLLRECRAEFPTIVFGHTAYDHPTLHGDDVDGVYDDGAVRGEYDWRGWVGDEGADLEEWQNYVTSGDALAANGSIFARVRSSNASAAVAVKKGWIREDLQVARYFQLHHTPFVEIVSASVLAPIVKGWCAPMMPCGRMDESGAWALRGMCALERAGLRMPGAIEAFQEAHGLDVDGRAGRQTLALLGVHVPAGVA
jgi:hypothetical protein